MTVDLRPYPMMDDTEVEALEAVLNERKPERVLEWGGGGSTLYWTEKHPEIDWVTIEHDPGWAKALSERIPGNVTLLKKSYPDYHQHDAKLGQFDLIIVDGRKRVMCLSVARSYLKDGGAVILHDAGRERYAPGIAHYKNKTVLSPPKNEKDPRGLYMLTDPRQGSRGVIYMAWGDNAVKQAEESMKSLWRFDPDMPVLVLGDRKTEAHYSLKKNVMFYRVDTDPFDKTAVKGFKFLAGRIKPLMAGISPFQETLYVDADTKFKASPSPGFNLLDRWDVALSETETRDLVAGIAGKLECQKTAKEVGTPHILYHNSGMIFWRKNERTKKLFDLWSGEWLRYGGWDEQVALLRALLRSDVMFLTLPYTWNCYHQKEAYILHHWFGSANARIEMKRSLHSGHVKQESQKIVKVQLDAGVWVRCYEGQEQQMIEKYKNMRGKR